MKPESSDPAIEEESRTERSAQRASALQKAITLLLPLTAADRENVLETLHTFFEVNSNQVSRIQSVKSSPSKPNFHFSEDSKTPSPKAFLSDKSPQTDVERVACIAYYLSHFRETPHVRTKDITALNTESAHKPFSNTAVAVDNATKAGYLVPSVKGSKQISAFGERYVEALPDRDAAGIISDQFRKRKQKR